MNIHKLRYYLEIILYRARIFEIMNLFKKSKKSNIIVRVDDFPHWNKSFSDFKKFDAIMKKHKIPYLLGVTPFVSGKPTDPNNETFRKLTKEEIEYLKKRVGENGIFIALHGYTHQSANGDKFSEFVGKLPQQVEREIIKGKKYLEENGLGTDIIMPPFNSFDKENLKIFKKHFKTITAGPETIRYLGKKKIGKIGKIRYIPSYFPYYLHPTKQFPKINSNICLTIHWAWFSEKEVERMAIEISRHNILKLAAI